MNVVRAVSSEGFGRLARYAELRRRLDSDRHVQRYFEQETTELPAFYIDQVRKDLGRLWEWLPADALYHDPHAYLRSEEEQSPKTVERSDVPRSGLITEAAERKGKLAERAAS
jgi:hypothetical protein